MFSDKNKVALIETVKSEFADEFIKNIMQEVSGGDTLIIDAYDGEIIINPDLITIEKFKKLKCLKNN